MNIKEKNSNIKRKKYIYNKFTFLKTILNNKLQ